MKNNLTLHPESVSAQQRCDLKDQKPIVLWLTGLSGAGKSTIANALEVELHARQRHTYLLDGDNVRTRLCGDLGFSEEDRQENIRRISEVSRLFVESGLIVITAFISPSLRDRAMAREIIGESAFVEVYIATPLSECERRDPKGLYRKAREGLIKNFTGIDAIYEAPVNPDITINTVDESLHESIGRIIHYLDEKFSR
ncbi:adenylyl-sulfate kinase [Pseudomonas umsongensis]|uniref:Adenylyl-sulfate kinase n=1 Tax=Pseudomonas umsongensis TaxID=198618 RepID=A0AAE6ZSM6_9PSED|nr:adenylyl-sulfate kinase [Pseudomonas umsongensis]QJC78457.1 adenylyl-sulfate kinase [Pseudomonas umsongensis]